MQDSPRPRAAAACRCPFYRAPEAVERLALRSPSQPPRGEEKNARPAPCEPPSVQENPCHNIIPSVLWNSRQHPHCHAVTASIREGQKPASAPSPASDSTIRIMLRNSVSPSNHPHPSGRSARRQERSFAPGPSPALARRKTPHFRGPPPQKCRPAQHQGRRGPSSPASTQTSCRRVQHSCGSARCQTSAVLTSRPAHVRPRSSKVEFNLAAIPPHRSRDKSRPQCSGQQGSGPSARWRRQCQSVPCL